MEDGQHDQHHGGGDGRRGDCIEPFDAAHVRLEVVSHLALAVGAQHQTGDGDADLTGGHVAVQTVGVLEMGQKFTRRGVAFLGQRLNANHAHGHRGELGGNVQRGHRHQKQDDEDVDYQVKGPNIERVWGGVLRLAARPCKSWRNWPNHMRKRGL